MVEYRQRDGILQEMDYLQRFIILQDTEIGLVAAKTHAAKDSMGFHLGASMIVIKRDTGELLVGPFYFRQNDKGANVDYRQGKCTQREITK